ncbi:MAG: sugar transferase [Salibacteraceae bacterium]|nr:sugar transferase [Salibacteraceae bacterium]
MQLVRAYNKVFTSQEIISIPNISAKPSQYILQRKRKRTFDFFLSSILLVFLTFTLFPTIGILIKFDSQGPVFFRQKRKGRNNRSFVCFKFRTMVLEENLEDNNARITKIGRVLRKYHLDELPQLLNVLKGEMSIVGPRPHMVSESKTFSNQNPHYIQRYLAKPGITGLAQVSGFFGYVDSLEHLMRRINYDLEYIETATFGLDLKIVYKTIVMHLPKLSR